MAGSDLIALPEGALDDVAARVGTCLRGNTTGRVFVLASPAPSSTGASGCVCSMVHSTRWPRPVPIANDVTVAWTPGAFELPLVARAFAAAGKVDAVLCFGAVVRGETGHYDFVAGECASGIQQVQLSTGMPVIFGVLTTETLDQALERSEPNETNKGREAALTGIEMVRLLRTGPLS